MARIRSIKPEFPQSETIGKLSRDARLLFVMLWTIVDDSGRARAASRMLASLLFPYDDDAPGSIDGWLEELEREDCIRRYTVDGSSYLDIPNWLKHQKIDKPSASKLPPFEGNSENPREASRKVAPDLGPRIRDLGKDQPPSEANASSVVARSERALPAAKGSRIPTDFRFDEKTRAVGHEEGLSDDIISREESRFIDHFGSAPGERGRKVNWQGTGCNWLREAADRIGRTGTARTGRNGSPPSGRLAAYKRAVDRFQAPDDVPSHRADLHGGRGH